MYYFTCFPVFINPTNLTTIEIFSTCPIYGGYDYLEEQAYYVFVWWMPLIQGCVLLFILWSPVFVIQVRIANVIRVRFRLCPRRFRVRVKGYFDLRGMQQGRGRLRARIRVRVGIRVTYSSWIGSHLHWVTKY